MVLLGFFLLTLQGVSQLIKRIAIIRGDLDEKDDMMQDHVPPHPDLADTAGPAANGNKH
jgi:hypothetical protein